MRSNGPRTRGVTTKLRIAGAILAIGGVLAGGVVWSGCGSDDSDTTTETTTSKSAQEQIEGGVQEAEKGLEEGAEQAQKGLEQAKKELQNSKVAYI